jgi:hypothetical protein
MPMKLLSFSERKDTQQKEQTLKILRTQEVEELASKANAKLARAEADFNATLATNRAKWAVEEQEHADRILSMSKEIEALESRKQQALIPISMYKKEADKIMDEAKEIANKIKEKEEYIDILTEKLEDKLTEVGDREKAVIEQESRITVALAGVKLQQEQVITSIQNLSDDRNAFEAYKQIETDKLAKIKEEIFLAETNFQAKTEKYKRDMEALRVWDIQLKDERNTLERERNRV